MSAIQTKSLKEFIKSSTIDDEVQKTNCIYDIVKYDGVELIDIKAEITDCLIMLNAGLSKNMQLTDQMIKIIVDMVINDFNTLTIPGFFKCIRKGIAGEYGQVYSMNVMTVTNWIQQYLSSEAYFERIDELRRKHEINKRDEINRMLKGDMADLMKAALKITDRKPVEYKPRQIHLDQFENVAKLFTDIELEKAINDWSKRQRPEYLSILMKEKESRSK